MGIITASAQLGGLEGQMVKYEQNTRTVPDPLQVLGGLFAHFIDEKRSTYFTSCK